MMEFINEMIKFIGDLASGKLQIDEARKRAADLQARQPEHLTDDLLAELDKKIDELD